MKRTNILFFIAAVALVMSLCGMFFYGNSVATSSVPRMSESTLDAEFSKEIALNCLSLCSAAYEEASLKSELLSMGYSDFEYAQKKQDTNYSNGIAFGISINNSDKNNVLVVIRGTYKKEWYSNFQIGENTEHAGFSAAADYVEEYTKEYLEKNNIDKTEAFVLITGHSRGGAVANLLSKRMIKSAEYKGVTAYTFACPNTTTDTDAQDVNYKNIYNIINPEDFICFIPLECWGYKRYGTDIILPKKGDTNYYNLYRSMQDKFFEITQSTHRGYPDGDRDVKRFLEAISEISPTVQSYYQKKMTLFPHRVTMYQYMQSAAAFLSDEQNISDGMILLSSGTSPAFSSMAEFIMQGINIDDMENFDITQSAMGCAHTFETYEAWIDILPDSYFSTDTSAE